MIKSILISLILLSLGGCSGMFPKPDTIKTVEFEVKTVEVPLNIIQPLLPPQVQMVAPKIHVITEKNLEDKIAEIEKIIDGKFVVVAMTLDDYENMAANIQEITRYIRQQRDIIMYYMEATAPKPEPESETPAEKAEQ